MERSEDMLVGVSAGQLSNLPNGDINAVIGAASNNGGGGGGGSGGGNSTSTGAAGNQNGSNERPAVSYTMPGILHYLQHEWNRFEFERQQWEIDRTELMTKISFLQGERRGQESLKNNLIRRIKMLEVALKQERVKYQKLKLTSAVGDAQSANELKLPLSATSVASDMCTNTDANEIESSSFSIGQHPILNKENNNTSASSSTSKQGRQLLKQYLQEIGYTDSIIDVRSSRLRALLGLKPGGTATNTTAADAAASAANQQIDILTSVTNALNSYSAASSMSVGQLDSIANLLSGTKLLQLSNKNSSNSSSSSSGSIAPTSATTANTSNNSAPSALSVGSKVGGRSTVSSSSSPSGLNATIATNGESDGAESEAPVTMNNLAFFTNNNNQVDATSSEYTQAEATPYAKTNGVAPSEEDDDSNESSSSSSRLNGSSGTTALTAAQQQQLSDDADTEDALKEFSFLSSESSSAAASSTSSDDDASDWNVDKAHLDKLTEQYRKDRRSTKTVKMQHQQQQQQQIQQLVSHTVVSSQRPTRATLQAMIANLATESGDSGVAATETESEQDSSVTSSENGKTSAAENESSGDTLLSSSTVNAMNPAANSTNSSSNSNGNKANNYAFSNSPKLFMDDDNSFASDSALGELSRISLGNTSLNASGINDETLIDSSTNSRKTIANKFSLRGHFDAVRCLAFHPTESILLTGSEDQTIKLWNLDKSSLSSKKNLNIDVEPMYTFRKHAKSVLSVLVSSSGEHCISSSTDGKIIVWELPNLVSTDQYDAYSPSVFVKYLVGHKDAVWSMAIMENTLASVSSDGSIRIWNPFSADELTESTDSLSCINENKSEGVPSSVDFVNSDKSKIVVSFGSTHHNVYDIETSKVINTFNYADSTTNTHCYKVKSSPINDNTPSSPLILSAHEDKKVRFYDMNSGKLAYHMVAHQDACTDLAIDPTCTYLLSASHDCSLRLWSLETKSCIQEHTSHRRKHDESIHCVAFHPTRAYIASGGADAVVKIYV